MYIQDALELVCEKRKLNPKDYALLLAGDQSILIPLDRTVASLQGQRELMVVKRSMLPQLGIDTVKTTPRTTDPNASIFKRISEVPIVLFSSAVDFTAVYKKYTVYRKMPMLVTRHERTFPEACVRSSPSAYDAIPRPDEIPVRQGSVASLASMALDSSFSLIPGLSRSARFKLAEILL